MTLSVQIKLYHENFLLSNFIFLILIKNYSKIFEYMIKLHSENRRQLFHSAGNVMRL